MASDEAISYLDPKKVGGVCILGEKDTNAFFVLDKKKRTQINPPFFLGVPHSITPSFYTQRKRREKKQGRTGGLE